MSKSSSTQRIGTLGEIEELVILAILKLGNDAYGIAIQDLVEKATKRTVNVRGLYTTLQRLEQKGFIKTVSPPVIESSKGRSRRYYAVQLLGKQALNATDMARRTWKDFREMLQVNTF